MSSLPSDDMRPLRGKNRLVLAALVLASVFALVTEYRVFAADFQHSFVRPDGRYRVDVYAEPALWFGMPGSGSDGPGYVVLRDRAGNELGRATLEMVQLAERVEWEPRHARIKLIAEWDLPD